MRVSSYRDEADLAPRVAAGETEVERATVRTLTASPGNESASGTVVELRNDGAAGGTSSREQRYNELLRNAPPSGSAETRRGGIADEREASASPPGVLQRMVAPIANALGLGSPKEEPAQGSPGTPAAAEGEKTSSRQPDEKTARSEEDPDTDIVPPQLLAAEFTPREVKDGEGTQLAVLVNDNLSGVRSVSGVIVSPSGTLTGFACRREGETNRYVARVSVPVDAASGVWVVKYMTLTDNASNTTTLLWAQGALPQTASFNVTSSSSDAAGPQLKAIWLDRPAMRGGERNTLFVQAEDDKSGIASVNGMLVSPGRQAHIGFGCREGAGGTWECTVAPPTCLDCGIWRLEQIQLQDKANNMTMFRSNNPVVGGVVLDIAGETCDAIPPVIIALSLTPDRISNSEANAITVRATVTDEGGCGVASLSGQTIPPGGVGGQRNYIPFRPTGDGQTFEGKLEIPKHAAKGRWTIAWINALDKGNNMRGYAAGDPVLSRVWFDVE